MSNSKIIQLKCNVGQFFTNYLLVTKPYHNLSDTEIRYTAMFMVYYNELSKSINKDDLIFELLFSSSTRKKIREDLKVNKFVNFNTVFNMLKKKQIFVVDEETGNLNLNQKYCLRLDSDKFEVKYIFNIKDEDKVV